MSGNDLCLLCIHSPPAVGEEALAILETAADVAQESFSSTNAGPALNLGRAAGARLDAISAMVEDIDQSPVPISSPSPAALQFENQLVQVRLGLAGSLFHALRAKHLPTAGHSLRVAMGCSAWGVLLGLPESHRDELEIAGLLHDIGKIGVPDHILLKPGRLTSEELNVVEQHRRIGEQILRGCCASNEVLEIVRYAGSWYDGSRGVRDVTGDAIPFGARMLTLVDAFDSMTTDQVFRRAMSRERAVAELFQYCGTQFDPNLTREFCEYLNADQSKLLEAVSRRWLKDLIPAAVSPMWRMGQVTDDANGGQNLSDDVFQAKLLEHMHDAVIFVDVTRQIILWNHAAERLTGVPASSVEHRAWDPELISLREENGVIVKPETCPTLQGIASGVQTFRRMQIVNRGGQTTAVDIHVIPVVGRNGTMHGATLLMRDASSQISLEQRVQTLHEKASTDPLTKVANRAEFNRFHNQLLTNCVESGRPFSLIMCDIDHFKKINDTYGHQAGDEVLVMFAALLQRHCRAGDLVARYGGEEFVMICADCDNNTATKRAEMIRKELAATAQPALNRHIITSSFGVTELQAGDSVETMLNRADRGLYQAKENGRNAVVQLGSGVKGEMAGDKPPAATGWFSWLTGGGSQKILERTLVSTVPLPIAAEKLKGYVCDQKAEIVSIDPKHVVLKIEAEAALPMRRAQDRAIAFLVELRLEERREGKDGEADGVLRTYIEVTIRPVRERDRRKTDSLQRAQQLLASLKSYLVACEA